MFQILIFSSLTLCSSIPISVQDSKSRPTHQKTFNHLQTSHKPYLFYQQPQQQPQHQQQQQQQYVYQPQYVPVQMLAKTAYVAQPQQLPAMIIITAQPTPTYAAPVQQLLNYFHGNPHARQQLLYGGAQQATAPTAGSYIVAAAPTQYYATPTATPTQYYTAGATPAPQYYYTTHAQPQQQTETAQAQPFQLNQIAEMAQVTAQRLYGGQIKTATPIVTGLENFTPEQQAQIKARLNDVISQDQTQQQQVGGAMSDFVPSPEIKAEEGGVAYIGAGEGGGQGYSMKN